MPYVPPYAHSVDLTLTELLPVSKDLVLGGGGGTVTPTQVLGTVEGVLSLRGGVALAWAVRSSVSGAFRLSGEVSTGVVFTSTAVGHILPGSRLSIIGWYDNAVFSGVHASTNLAFSPQVEPVAPFNAADWGPGTPSLGLSYLEFDVSPTQAASIQGVGWSPVIPAHTDTLAVADEAEPLGNCNQLHWGAGRHTDLHVLSSVQEAAGAGISSWLNHASADARPVWHYSDWDGTTHPLEVYTVSPNHRAARVHVLPSHSPWDIAKPVVSYGGPFVPWVEPPPPTKIRETDLILCRPLGTTNPRQVALVLGEAPCGGIGSLTIPILRTYLIVNYLSLKRVSDGLPITTFSVSVGTDLLSWCWTLSAQIAPGHLERVDPYQNNGLVEVELEVNSEKWRFMVESHSSSEAFGKTQISISGRSPTLVFDTPYAGSRTYTEAYTKNAVQLAQQELDLVRLGTTLDWDFVDQFGLGWSVPANAMSYQDKSPLQAVLDLVHGSGGVLTSHRMNTSFIVRPEYRLPYWLWDDPSTSIDLSMPRAYMKSRGSTYKESPEHDGVLVSGDRFGVSGLIRRTGTLGSFQPQPYAHWSITSVAVARNVGMKILQNTGRSVALQIQTPLSPTYGGLVTPGKLVEVLDGPSSWVGMSRAVQVQAAFQTSLVVSQTFELERHLT